MTLRVVLDVNILASAAVTGGLPARIFEMAVYGHYELFISSRMLLKLDEVLRRPYFASRMSESARNAVLARTRKTSELVIPDPSVTGVADDDEDDQVLGTAISAGADFLVTGDRGLLVIGTYRGIRIVTAREFLTLLSPTDSR